MTSTIRHITIECRDHHVLAHFWSAVLGYVEDPENPNGPDDPEALLIDFRLHHRTASGRPGNDLLLMRSSAPRFMPSHEDSPAQGRY